PPRDAQRLAENGLAGGAWRRDVLPRACRSHPPNLGAWVSVGSFPRAGKSIGLSRVPACEGGESDLASWLPLPVGERAGVRRTGARICSERPSSPHPAASGRRP